MCIRTKTSYGCGHAPKTTVECNKGRHCPDIERWHYQKDVDCRACKQGGSNISRGREGHGRYAQEIRRKESSSSKNRPPVSQISSNSTASSPWAPPSKEEKEWRSPIRQNADELWMQEHEMRQTDLESKSRSQTSSRQHKPHHSTPREHYREPSSTRAQRQRDETEARLQEEISRINELDRVRARRQVERSGSYSSFPDLDARESSSRSRTSSHVEYIPRAPPPPPPAPHFYPQAPTPPASPYGHGGLRADDIVRGSSQMRRRW